MVDHSRRATDARATIPVARLTAGIRNGRDGASSFILSGLIRSKRSLNRLKSGSRLHLLMRVAVRAASAMNVKRPITIAIAAMFLIGGVAAVGAASPADPAEQNAHSASNQAASDAAAPNETVHDENATEEHDGENATEEHDGDADERAGNADERTETADGVGPSDGLPEQAPDRVGEIHDTIDSFLNGSSDGLGGSLSDLLSGEDAADGNADGATENDDGNADGNEDSDVNGNDDTDGVEGSA